MHSGNFDAKDISVALRGNDGMSDFDNGNMDAQELLRLKQDTVHRHSLIVWMMIVVSAWLFVVIFIISTNGPLNLNIDDTVLVTLLATTTANVLGLPLIILKDLFKGRA